MPAPPLFQAYTYLPNSDNEESGTINELHTLLIRSPHLATYVKEIQLFFNRGDMESALHRNVLQQFTHVEVINLEWCSRGAKKREGYAWSSIPDVWASTLQQLFHQPLVRSLTLRNVKEMPLSILACPKHRPASLKLKDVTFLPENDQKPPSTLSSGLSWLTKAEILWHHEEPTSATALVEHCLSLEYLKINISYDNMMFGLAHAILQNNKKSDRLRTLEIFSVLYKLSEFWLYFVEEMRILSDSPQNSLTNLNLKIRYQIGSYDSSKARKAFEELDIILTRRVRPLIPTVKIGISLYDDLKGLSSPALEQLVRDDLNSCFSRALHTTGLDLTLEIS